MSLSERAIAEDVDAIASTPAAVLAHDTIALSQHLEGLWEARGRRWGLGHQVTQLTIQGHNDVNLHMRLRHQRSYEKVEWRVQNILPAPMAANGCSGRWSWAARGAMLNGLENNNGAGASLEQQLFIESVDDPKPQTEVIKRIRIDPEDYQGVVCAMLYHPQHAGIFPAESFRFLPDEDYYEPLFVINTIREALGDTAI